jgi:aspartate/glutamate racemase
MKTIGMLGGMSWESTALYYRTANELVRERHGGLASADLLVRSLDFLEVRRLQLEDRWDDAADLLLREAKALEAAAPTWSCCAPTTCTRSHRRSRRASASRSCTSPTSWAGPRATWVPCVSG